MEQIAAWWARFSMGGVRSALIADGLLALVIGGLAAQGSWSAAADVGVQLRWTGFVLVGVAAASLVVRRVWPLVALAGSFGATVAYLLADFPYSPIVQLVAVAMYSVAAWCSRRVSALALTGTLSVYVPLALWKGDGIPQGFAVLPVAGLWLGLPWLAGAGVRAYRAVRAAAADGERRGFVMEERLRMSREIHDVVGHSLAVINMQAGVALHVLHRRPERAEQALRAMRETSSAALEELRGALALLGEQTGGDRSPAAGIERLSALAESVRQAGLAVELTFSGERRMVPAAVDVAVYRIVQESLTNVLRHAGATHAWVELSFNPGELQLTVADDGRGMRGVAQGGGRGLAGMRERVASLAGWLETGRASQGGLEVRAMLPLADLGASVDEPD